MSRTRWQRGLARSQPRPGKLAFGQVIRLDKVTKRFGETVAVDELSLGQGRRVGVARALAADPPVLLMDEPFGAIDPITRDRLQVEFMRLQDEVRKTIIFVTHDIEEAVRMGDRIAILADGGRLEQ